MSAVKGKLPALFLAAMMVAVAAAACVETPAPFNKAPLARIGSPVNQATFDNGVIITFDGSGSYDPEKKALTFSWSFGDGQNGTGNKTTHSYALPGKYIVSLEVSDGKKKGMDRAELFITQANRAPAVQFSAGNTTVSNEETVAFNASATTDADNDTLVFNWAFGDGATAQGKVSAHLFAAVGTYNVTLNVSDGKTTATLMRTITVYQANRAPVPALKATPLAAFINSAVEFDASGSTDADGDNLSASWDFGDGTNGTGLRASHAYSKMGNFTVSGTVRDGKAERSANLIVTVLPRATILVDWNGTDYGYIIKTESQVDKANLKVNVRQSAPFADDEDAPLTELAKDRYRAQTGIAPKSGLGYFITVYYWGLEIGERDFKVFGGTPMPEADCTVKMDATMSEHSSNATVETTTNMSGVINVDVREYGSLADFAFEIMSGMTNQTKRNDDNSTTRMLTKTLGGWFNQTMQNGTVTGTGAELSSEARITTLDEAAKEVQNLSAVSFQRTAGRNTTEFSLHMEGLFNSFTFSQDMTTLGLENHDNRYGKIFPCLKIYSSSRMEWFSPDTFGNPVRNVQYTNETLWNVQDEERYENTTVYHNYTFEKWLENATTGAWELIYHAEDSGFVDSNGDGTYNPDEKPLGMDDAFAFDGPVPGALVKGDRIVAVNAHGITVVMEVLDGSVRTINGTAYDVVHLQTTISGFDGNATGVSETWVVSGGNLTGLVVESKETKSWVSGGWTTEKTASFKASAIKED